MFGWIIPAPLRTSANSDRSAIAGFILHRGVFRVRVRRHDRLGKLQTGIITTSNVDPRRVVPYQVHRQLDTYDAGGGNQYLFGINAKLRTPYRCHVPRIDQSLLAHRAVRATAIRDHRSRRPSRYHILRNSHRWRNHAVLREGPRHGAISLRVEQTQIVLVLSGRLDAGEYATGLKTLSRGDTAAIHNRQIVIVTVRHCSHLYQRQPYNRAGRLLSKGEIYP